MPELDRIKDEELVHLAQAEEPGPALHALAERFLVPMCRWIARLARAAWLPAEDTRDAQQEAFFTLREAVHAFAPGRPGGAGRRGFRRFLRLKVTSRFLDFSRNLRRAEKHFDRSCAAAAALREAAGDFRPGTAPPGPFESRRRPEPELATERKEQCERLRQAVNCLDPSDRWLLEQHLAGIPLRRLAVQLQTPYHQVKYQWHKILVQLAARLQELDE